MQPPRLTSSSLSSFVMIGVQVAPEPSEKTQDAQPALTTFDHSATLVSLSSSTCFLKYEDRSSSSFVVHAPAFTPAFVYGNFVASIGVVSRQPFVGSVSSPASSSGTVLPPESFLPASALVPPPSAGFVWVTVSEQ